MHLWTVAGSILLALTPEGPAPLRPAALIYIDPAGNDSTGDGTVGNPFRTPQKAIDTVDPSGTIRVRPGSYPFQATIPKSVRIEAAGPGACTFGPGPFPGPILSLVGADDVTLVGLEFSGSTTGRAVQASAGSDRLTIDGCTFTGFGNGCIRVDGPTNQGHVVKASRFTSNRGTGALAAISLNAAQTSQVTDCSFYDCDRGIDLVGSNGTVVTRCSFQDLFQSAVVAASSTNLLVEDCRMTRCGQLATPATWAFPSDELGSISLVAFSHGAIVRRTTLEECGGYVGKNVFVGSALIKYDGLFGIGILDSNNVTIEDCSLHRNHHGGIHASGASPGLVIRRCNLVQNGERNDPGKDTALFTGGLVISAMDNFWGLPSGPNHDGAGFGNGIDGGGAVSIFPVADKPYVSLDQGFAPLPDVPTGTRPLAIVLGDFSGDGKPDLAVAEDQSGSVSVSLALGFGVFGSRTTTVVGGQPVALAPGKFDADTFLDLAVLDQLNDRVIVLFGDGTGGFTPGRTRIVNVARRPVRLRVADLDGGNRDDIVVACEGDVLRAGALQWLANDGAGNFTVRTLAGTAVPTDVEALDMNADGRPEILAFDRTLTGTPGLRTYANLGAGTFGAAVVTAIDASPILDAMLLRTNVDGGADDLVVADYTFGVPPGVTNVRLFRGTGAGVFLPPVLLRQDLGPLRLCAGTFTGVGQQSLVLLNPGSASVQVHGPVVATPTPFVPYASKISSLQYAPAAVSGDVTGDGIPDLLIADGGGARVLALRGERAAEVLTYGTGCTGTFGIPTVRSTSTPKIGAATFTIGFEHATANAAAVLFIGLDPANIPLPGGCSLLVDYLITVNSASDANGIGFIPLGVPYNPVFVGGGFVGQWFVLDPLGQVLNIVSGTSGFRIIVGG